MVKIILLSMHLSVTSLCTPVGTLQGYEYEFFAPQPDFKEPIMIATSGHVLYDPVTAFVEVPNNQWTLLVAPRQGWVPSWRSPMLATVIIISAIFGGLVMATLVSRHLQLWLLKETKASSGAAGSAPIPPHRLLGHVCTLYKNMSERAEPAHAPAC